jgi:hypothetical protein
LDLDDGISRKYTISARFTISFYTASAIDIIVDPPRDSTDPFAIGGAIAICLGLAPLIYGIVTLHDDILHRIEKKKDEERKV